MHYQIKTTKSQKMKTNQIFDNIIEAQTQAINNWVDSTKQFQTAFSSGNVGHEGQSIYKDWLDKQMRLFSGVQANYKMDGFDKPEEFFKNWYDQQLENTKKMTDFNQSLYNSVANFGKNPIEYADNISSVNRAWTNIYSNWVNVLNVTHSTYTKNFSSQTGKDAFKNIFDGSQAYLKLQEFWKPLSESFNNGSFSADSFKKMFTQEAYKQLSEQVFSSMFQNGNLKEVFDASMKNIQDFFSHNNNLSKEYFQAFRNISEEFPQLVSGDFGKVNELYKHVTGIFSKSFEPVLKMANPGKEKEAIEENIALLDRIAEYAVKQAEVQMQLMETTRKSLEASAKGSYEKYSQLKPENLNAAGFNEFYNEWIKISENHFTELFASEDFSKLKGDLVNVSMDVKKQFEKRFENVFNIYPVVFRSEVDDVYKTIHDLKKQVKNLETRLAAQSNGTIAFEEEKPGKPQARRK